MLAVAGGILIAILVLLFIPEILKLAMLAVIAVVAIAVVALVVLTDTGQVIAGLVLAAGVAWGTFALWRAFYDPTSGSRGRKMSAASHPTPGSPEYLDWANFEGEYDPNKQRQAVPPPPSPREPSEYLMWANREGRYADPATPLEAGSRTNPNGPLRRLAVAIGQRLA